MHIAIDNLRILYILWIMQPTVGNLVDYLYMTILTSWTSMACRQRSNCPRSRPWPRYIRTLTETRAIYLYAYAHGR